MTVYFRALDRTLRRLCLAYAYIFSLVQKRPWVVGSLQQSLLPSLKVAASVFELRKVN